MYDVSKNVKGMVEKIHRFQLLSPEHIEDLSVALQDFYQLFNRRLQTHQCYKGIDHKRVLASQIVL